MLTKSFERKPQIKSSRVEKSRGVYLDYANTQKRYASWKRRRGHRTVYPGAFCCVSCDDCVWAGIRVLGFGILGIQASLRAKRRQSRKSTYHRSRALRFVGKHRWSARSPTAQSLFSGIPVSFPRSCDEGSLAQLIQNSFQYCSSYLFYNFYLKYSLRI